MKIQDIIQEWKKDCQIDCEDLGLESTKTMKLHAKYAEYLIAAKVNLRERKRNYKRLLLTEGQDHPDVVKTRNQLILERARVSFLTMIINALPLRLSAISRAIYWRTGKLPNSR